MKRMLLVFAHPDDESFSTGLTVAKYVKAGWSVSLIVATSGEEGSSGPYGDLTPPELGSVRAQELSDACRVLGIQDIIHLGYHDGLVNKESPGILEDVLYRHMIKLSPDIVITHDTEGITHHPDHIRVCFSTTFAFQKYAGEIHETRIFVEDIEHKNPDVKKRHFVSAHSYALQQERFADIVEGDGVPKLYYCCVPKSVISYLQKKKELPAELFGKPFVGTEDKRITTVIDGSREKLTKLKALAKHKTQAADVDRFYEDETHAMITKEFFILRMHGTTEVFMGKQDAVSGRL